METDFKSLVSVIIPNYNHGAFLKMRIESVINQSFQNFEVIILDDSSTDQSRSIIESYKTHPKVKKIMINAINSGSTFKQWKKGLEECSGDYVWIAESDDYCSLDFLATHVRNLDANTNINLSYCQSMLVNENNQPQNSCIDWVPAFKRAIFENDFVMDSKIFRQGLMIKTAIIPNASAVVFRKFDHLINDLDANWKFCGDWKFWWDVLNAGSMSFVAKPLNFFRRHDNIVSKPNSPLFVIERLRLLKIFFYTTENQMVKSGIIKHYFDIKFPDNVQTLPRFISVASNFMSAPSVVFRILFQKLITSSQ